MDILVNNSWSLANSPQDASNDNHNNQSSLVQERQNTGNDPEASPDAEMIQESGNESKSRNNFW